VTGRDAYIALNMMERIGPAGVRALVSALGSVESIFTSGADELANAEGVRADTVKAILRQRDTVEWQGEKARAETEGVTLLTPLDERYPAALKQIYDPPLALYVKGTVQHRDRHGIAVVGTRRPTHYGRECAERFAYGLAKAGFTVVSGLAEGVDTAAHRGALNAGGRTLAVIGSGLDHVYPESNRELGGKIAASGAVMTEFPFSRAPDKTTFPMRNRIVSGLSMGVLVVEAGIGSGALITVNQALEQGRTVFAVPGRIDSAASQGTHRLIQNGAALVVGVDDVLKEFGDLFRQEPGPVSAERTVPAPALSADEERVLALLADEPRDVDSLIRETGIAAAAMSGLLIGLEMKRRARMLPGRIVEAARSRSEPRHT
jgi:DNA processing protein